MPNTTPLKRAAGRTVALRAAVCSNRPHPSVACLSKPCRVYSPKRAAGNTEMLRAAVCNCCPTTPRLAKPDPSVRDQALPVLQREQQRKPKLPVLPSAAINLSWPGIAAHRLTKSRHTTTTLQREQQGRHEPSVLLSAAIAAPCLASPRIATAVPCHSKLGLTPKDAQPDQATSASMRLRLSVTGTTSVSKRPCLGLQSPSPTSLPASLAISSTSRRFNTSGSY